MGLRRVGDLGQFDFGDHQIAHQHHAVVVLGQGGITAQRQASLRDTTGDHMQVGPGLRPGFPATPVRTVHSHRPARTGGGTGLGLAITATLAARSDGQVTAANHPDGGAVMTVTRPRESENE